MRAFIISLYENINSTFTHPTHIHTQIAFIILISFIYTNFTTSVYALQYLLTLFTFFFTVCSDMFVCMAVHYTLQYLLTLFQLLLYNVEMWNVLLPSISSYSLHLLLHSVVMFVWQAILKALRNCEHLQALW